MSGTYRFVKLLKNHLYPTYQLHAFMANEKTAPQDGLRLAALTTMDWLKNRLGEAAPPEWAAIPAPEEYLSAADADLPSAYVNQGHVINIVSLPEKGMWTLQITEPDLGSDPGKPDQRRPPVPGRIIETNIAFRTAGRTVECGFKTVISDPVGTAPEAEVYRIAVVKLLMENPAFGLKQVTDIPMKPLRLASAAQVKTMLGITHSAENQLPAVIFTQPAEQKAPASPPPFPGRPGLGSAFSLPMPDLSGLPLPRRAAPAPAAETVVSEPPYDLDRFCYYTFSHCRTYVLENAANEAFTARSGVRFRPGDIVVLYPASLGGGERVIPYDPSDAAREETIRAVEKGVKDCLKTRSVDFGGIMFLSGVREHLLGLSDELAQDAEAAGERFEAELRELTACWKSEIAEKDRQLEEAADQLRRQKEYAARLEDEKAALREEFELEREDLQNRIDSHLAAIEFWKRRCGRPQDYDGIPAWVEEHFSDHLLLHPKAVDRMLASSRCAAVDLICDALDYLATDCWDMRYLRVPRELALTRCSEKYGRPFDVVPNGQMTIDFTPGEYKIKYFRDAMGKQRESALDWHLRVGNDTENLLRIYFLYDDENRLIVVGSLPDHLKTVIFR